ncbi:MAG: pyridoxamine 5'-phosphate oxidase family protein [Acidimicrobiia bacterium]|nr:pyridoxamine 5'-phosphate oxidase family protein [Acidimicrobiia bacterium]MDH4365081.1 pyridoxamine 5'-phosphate oxidase family protein [Acidimicrobiia bacterium]MDH5291307.1 pyridoxamine 5'-phosphate oxidase family protein [Acidimicrobiia bacterium]
MMDEDGAGHELGVVTEAEAWQLVRGRELGRLAVCIAGVPEIFPVNYRLDIDGAVVVRTAPGLKLAGALLGGEVAFEVDQIDEAAHTGWSVVIHGRATEVAGTEARLHTDDLGVDPWVRSPKHRYLRVAPDRISGRRVV